MPFEALLEAAIKGVVVLGLAGLLTGIMRNATAAARHLVWVASILIVLAMPALCLVLPGWGVLPHWRNHAPLLTAPVLRSSPGPAARTSTGVISRQPVPSDSIPLAEPKHLVRTPGLTAQSVALLAWAAIGGVLLGRIVVGLLSLAWLRRHSEAVSSGPATSLLAELCRDLGICRTVDLRSSPSRKMPMTWGLCRSHILLPMDFASWSPAILRTVLLHELAHVRRRDCLAQLAAQFACAIHWFNPLVWFALKRMQVEREQACDDLVLRSGTKASDYAEQLLRIATQSHRPACGPLAIAMARPGTVESRLRAILDVTRNRRAITWTGIAVCLIAAVAVAVLMAMLRGADGPLTQAQVAQIAAIQQSGTLSPFPTRITVRGTVRTTDGAPLPAGAFVQIQSKARNRTFGYSAKPKQDGSFEQSIDLGDILVSFDSKGYAPAFAGPLTPDAKGDLPPVNLIREPGFACQVRVVDSAGKPVVGAAVTSVFIHGFYVGARKGSTGADGLVSLDHLTGALPARLDVSAEGFEWEKEEVTFKEGEVHLVHLTPAKATTGTIVDAGTGAPLAGVKIQMLQRKGFDDRTEWPREGWPQPPVVATSDQAGRFVLSTLRSDCVYAFFVDDEDHGCELFQGVRAGQELRWKLGPEKVIRGRITGDLSQLPRKKDAAGQTTIPVSCVNPISVGEMSYESRPKVQAAVADGVGTFEFRDPFPGEVRFALAGQSVQISTANIPPVVELHFGVSGKPDAPHKREVVFKLEVPEGAPLPQGTLRFLHPGEEGRGLVWDTLPVTSGEGRYQMRVPCITGYSPEGLAGYWIEERSSNPVGPGEEPLVLRIPTIPAGAVQGRVLEPDGHECVTGFAVSFLEIAKSPALATRSVNLQPFNSQSGSGSFVITPLPLGGCYRFVATSRDRIAMSEEIRLDSRQPLRSMDLRFAEGIPLRVEVTDADGRLRAGVQIRLGFKMPSHLFSGATRNTGRGGFIVFEHINPKADGSYYLEIEAGSDYPGAQSVPVRVNGQTVKVALARGCPLKGQVLSDLSGRPLEHRQVTAYPTRGNRSSQPSSSFTLTDSDGRFCFTNLDSGEYRLDVADTAPAGSSFEKRPDGTTSIRYPPNRSEQPTVRGGQSQEVVLRVVPID